MKKIYLFRFARFKLLINLFFLIFLNFTISAQEVVIDLKNGTINGKFIMNCTVESITDILGRPMALDNSPIFGPILKYHDLGLEVKCRPKSKDNVFNIDPSVTPDVNQHVYELTIFLTKTWDEDALEFFILKNVIFVPHVDGNLKVIHVKEQFGDLITKISTAKEQKEMKTKILGRIYTNAMIVEPDRVYMNFNRHDVTFLHEAVTKFLEEIKITSKEE